ncbi:putative RNA polymerase ii mediator complex subunit protein [Rosellinia necatrix]|uniref:Mediator of RNA polymerase II transcription subunit 18 n=1 Tax=Rosellinia necatrix TaxID=77044 RepID=A0A1W2TUF5_ROSNE|nr:putative RNA polymerase ii mediator complex subunit protein [Rosellinia necatrix]
MHELFLTASVSQEDFDTACAILQGLSWMTARRTVYRILYFAGQPQPRSLPVTPQAELLPRQQDRQLWVELSRQLQRSSYVLQAAYEVSPETDFGRGGNNNNNIAAAAPTDLNRLPATLRWTDLPDPLRDSPITSRKKIEIPFRFNLRGVLLANQHTYTNELIQESYSFNQGDLEIMLSRYYHLPAEQIPGQPQSQSQPQPQPAPQLPPWADLRPVDPAQKWALTVKLHVAEDGQPERLAKATEELLRNKAELDRLFDFRPVDRRVFDTRVAPPPVVPGRAPP